EFRHEALVEEERPLPAEPAVTRADVARGAGLAGLSRMGALIEALAQPLYTWLFGIATYGIYVVLWGAVNRATNIVHLSMPLARRAFGPEIRLRIFWEQIARIFFALGFFALGAGSLGLMAAHLCSLAMTALLSIRLLGSYYDLNILLRAKLPRLLVRDLIVSG